MSFGFSGQRSPFSPSTTPNWGFQTSQPTFGVNPASTPFRSTGGGFLTSTPAPAPRPFAPQASGGFFNQPQPTPFSAPLFQTQQVTQWNPWQPQQPQQQQNWNAPPQQAVNKNAFREEFYRVVVRQDKRDLTIHTRINELEELGQGAIKMIE